MEQILKLLDSVASSEHSALLIALSIALALGWGWWRRENMHIVRYEQLRKDSQERENNLLKCLSERNEELDSLAKESLGVLQDVASALAGMERTLDGIDALVHIVLNERLHKDGGQNEG